MNESSPKTIDGYDHTPPHAASISESMRAFGYDLPTALADLVDNSISAGSKNVWLRFEWAGSDSVIVVTDDGHGMLADELIEAMRLGTQSPLAARSVNDLGRFGLGLKTASISQCRRLTVRSHRDGAQIETRCWDLDVIASTNDWRLLRSANAAAEAHFLKVNSLAHGTAVLWQNLDRLTRDQQTQNEKHHQRFLDRIDGVRRHLGMVFHRLMTAKNPVKLFINDRLVEPWDPFMGAHSATLRLSTDPLNLNGIKVHVQPYVLPHFSKLSKVEHDAGGGPRGWLDHQGFYVYRRDRLLVAGDWLGFGWTKDEHLKLARIAVDLPNTLDHEWQINVTKSRATPPLALRDDLKRIAMRTREEAKKVYTHRGARLIPNATSARVHLWEPVAKHDRTFYRINKDHPLVLRVAKSTSDMASFTALLTMLQETVPLQHISISSTEKPDSQPQPFEGTQEAQIRAVMIELFKSLRFAGESVDGAREKIRSYWPFELFPSLLATLDETIA